MTDDDLNKYSNMSFFDVELEIARDQINAKYR